MRQVGGGDPQQASGDCNQEAVSTAPDVRPGVVSQHSQPLRPQNAVVLIQWNENQVIMNLSNYSSHAND